MIVSGEGLTYQWFGPDGELSDTAREIAGSSTNTLRVLNVQSDDTGSYRVRIFNVAGEVESVSASLRISKIDIIRVCVLCYCCTIHLWLQLLVSLMAASLSLGAVVTGLD